MLPTWEEFVHDLGEHIYTAGESRAAIMRMDIRQIIQVLEGAIEIHVSDLQVHFAWG